MIFQTRAGDYRKMGTEQCVDGVTFTFQCPKELACAVVLFEKRQESRQQRSMYYHSIVWVRCVLSPFIP